MGPGGKENKEEALLFMKVPQEYLLNPEENFALPTVAGTPSPVPALRPHTLGTT